MFMLAGPLLVLFFAAIGLCMLNDKRRARQQSKIAAETEATADLATPASDLENL
jgi:sec-independent protein translocase protein TatC